MKKILLAALSIALFSPVFSQAPGGVAAGGSLEFWFDAQQLTLSDLDKVSSWTDVANGHNATPIHSSFEPTFRTSQVNGKSIVDFDGTDFLTTGAIPNLETNTITHFAVFDGSPANHEGVVVGGNYATHSQFLMTYRQLGNFRSWIINSPSTIVDNLRAINPSYQIFNGMFDGMAGTVSSYLDGGDFKTKSGATTTPVTNNYYRIGSNPAGGGGNRKFNGGMGDVFAYSSILNTAERLIVENYLGAKYNIAVATDMYAYQAVHSYGVIGIGQEADGNNLSATGFSNLTLSGAGLVNGDYVISGHDNAGYAANTSDIPGTVDNRYDQVWRADFTNYSGLVTLAFDVNVFGLGDPTGYRLLTDADGVFAAGATETVGVEAGGIVTFAGVDLTTLSYFTLANNSSAIISAVASGFWHVAASWSCSCVPTAGSDITILTGHQINVSGANGFVNNITIDAGGILNWPGSNDSLFVAGNFDNDGTLNAGVNNSTVYLNGSSAQTISGVCSFNNLTWDNAAGLTNTGTISIKSWLHSVNGSIATGDAITLLSSASGTGAIRNPTAGSVSGDVIVERYLDEGEDWYLLSPMVIGGDLEDWNQEFEMQGFPGTEWFPTSSSVYYFDQNDIIIDFNEGYKVPGNTTDLMPSDRGYEIYIGNDSYGSLPKTIDITGKVELGTQVMSCPHIVKLGVPADDGWTLMANPYCAPFRWAEVTRSANFDNAYRRRKDGSNEIIANGSIMGSGEALWVHSNVGGCTVTFDVNSVWKNNIDFYNYRTTNSGNEGEQPLLKIGLDYGESIDETFLGFDENAIDAKESGTDAYKLDNRYLNKPNISTVVAGDDLYKNVLNANTNAIVPIRIYTNSSSGILKSYNLILENVTEILENNKVLRLEDRALNTFTDVTGDLSIPFTIMDDVNTPRFYLHVESPLTITVKNVTCESAIDGSVTASIKEIGIISFVWKDAKGTTIKTSLNNNGTDHFSNLPVGNYSVEVSSKGNPMMVSKFEITSPTAISSNFEMHSAEILQDTRKKNRVLEVAIGEKVEFENLSTGNANFEWDMGDLAVVKGRDISHVYYNEGLYTINLKANNGSCEVNSTQNLRVLSNNNTETNLLNDFDVIVNENGILVSLNNEDSKNVSFSIYNSIGQEVFLKDVNAEINHQERIKLDNAQGVYLITVKDSENTKTKKIVLSKK